MTMEDLVEELVGDITDEYDVVVEERIGVRGDLVIDGLTTLDDFAEKTGLVLAAGSLRHAGWVFHGPARSAAERRRRNLSRARLRGSSGRGACPG